MTVPFRRARGAGSGPSEYAAVGAQTIELPDMTIGERAHEGGQHRRRPRSKRTPTSSATTLETPKAASREVEGGDHGSSGSCVSDFITDRPDRAKHGGAG